MNAVHKFYALAANVWRPEEHELKPDSTTNRLKQSSDRDFWMVRAAPVSFITER